MFALRTWVRYVAALSSKASNLLHETSPMCFFKLCFGRICRSEVACPADFCHLLSHSLCGRSFGSCCRGTRPVFGSIQAPTHRSQARARCPTSGGPVVEAARLMPDPDEDPLAAQCMEAVAG